MHAHCTRGRSTLMTIIRNPALYWSSQHLRWLAPSELLAVHNLPTRPWLATLGNDDSSFLRDRRSWGMPARRRLAMIQQAGNGMSLSVLDVCLQWTWALQCIGTHMYARRCALTTRSMNSTTEEPDSDHEHVNHVSTRACATTASASTALSAPTADGPGTLVRSKRKLGVCLSE